MGPPAIDEDEAARLYNEGKPMRVVAEKLGTTLERVRTILRKRDDVIIRRGSGAPRVNRDPSAAGAALRQVLAKRGLSQADVARRIGISAKHLSQVLVGVSSISVDLAVQLELVFKINGRALLHLQANDQYDRARRAMKDET
jgi:plasmid maintenance system antidote protein VapI